MIVRFPLKEGSGRVGSGACTIDRVVGSEIEVGVSIFILLRSRIDSQFSCPTSGSIVDSVLGLIFVVGSENGVLCFPELVLGLTPL